MALFLGGGDYSREAANAWIIALLQQDQVLSCCWKDADAIAKGGLDQEFKLFFCIYIKILNNFFLYINNSQ